MKQAFKYRIVVEWSETDKAYVARVPALLGCAAHGSSPEKAAAEARLAARAMLDVLREDGEPPPPQDLTADFSGQIRLRMLRSLHARLSRLAELEDTSLNHPTRLSRNQKGCVSAARESVRPASRAWSVEPEP